MQKIKIITDSASDISKEDEKKLGIKVMCFPVAVDGQSYRERLDFTNNQFYRMMDNAKEMPKTSQLTAFEILEVFRNLHKEGWTDVIYVTISSTGSATYSNALSAAAEFKSETAGEEGTPMRIHIVDSKNYTAVYGYPVTQAALKAQKGETPEKIIEYLKDWFETAEVIFIPMTLKYAKKSGRISSVSAFAGELLGLRPVVKIANGVSTVIDKVRGEKNIIPKMVEVSESNMTPQTPYIVITGSNPDITNVFAEKMEEILGYPPDGTVQIGAAVACNAGHNVIGIVVKGRKNAAVSE